MLSALTGCRPAARYAPPSTHGPVHLGNSPGTICLPTSVDGALTMGFDVIRSKARSAVRITAVTLRDARGLTVAGAYLMPVRHRSLVGVTNRWPPQHPSKATGGDWDARVNAVGTGRLDPGSGVHDWNLVMKLTIAPDVDIPRYQAVSVQYTSSGSSYVAYNATRLVVKPKC